MSAEWMTGEGIALTMITTVPPDGHIADARIFLRDDGGFELIVGTAEFGNGTYGAEAAAERFFHRPAARLSRSDAATLAAVLPNPERYSAAAPSRYVLQRRDWILGQMQALGGPEMLSEIDAYPDRRR